VLFKRLVRAAVFIAALVYSESEPEDL